MKLEKMPGNPYSAYYYAEDVDKCPERIPEKPHAKIQNPHIGMHVMQINVQRKYWEAACKDPITAWLYAADGDKRPEMIPEKRM